MTEPEFVWITWVGPEGHRASAVFDHAELVPGERYRCPADRAAVLVKRHPEFWALEAPKSAEE